MANLQASLAYRNHRAAIWGGKIPEKYLRVARHVTGKRVLELGSAEGVLAVTLAERGHAVTGVELRPARHAEAVRFVSHRAQARNVQLVCGDILQRLELLVGIDTLVAVRSIYYLREQASHVLRTARAAGVREVVLCGNRNRATQSAMNPETDLGRFNRPASIDGMQDLLIDARYAIAEVVPEGDPIVVGVAE
jgi:SAM-dependent methyltransferase